MNKEEVIKILGTPTETPEGFHVIRIYNGVRIWIYQSHLEVEFRHPEFSFPMGSIYITYSDISRIQKTERRIDIGFGKNSNMVLRTKWARTIVE